MLQFWSASFSWMYDIVSPSIKGEKTDYSDYRVSL
jgi:hypothetical protein